jgi:hypothetical protein
MSSKIEVDRNLLAEIYNHHATTTAHCDQLRALLSAPVVERQPDAWEYSPKRQTLALRHFCTFSPDPRPSEADYEVHKLYRAPLELAELQAKCELSDIRISQLTVAIEQSSKAQLENYHMATRAWTEQKELEATIARLTAEIERLMATCAKSQVERLKGGQGEAASVLELLRETSGYLDGSINNSVWCDSILHRKMKTMLNKTEETKS